MSQLYTIADVKNEEKIGKKGPYTYTRLRVDGEGVWRTGFGNAKTWTWQPGDVVALELFEEDWEGKQQYKFRVPRDGGAKQPSTAKADVWKEQSRNDQDGPAPRLGNTMSDMEVILVKLGNLSQQNKAIMGALDVIYKAIDPTPPARPNAEASTGPKIPSDLPWEN